MYRALRPGGVFAFPVGAPPPITSGWYWALLGFDLAMRVRNAVWRPPFVMYYRTCPLHAVRDDLTASGFTVTTVPLTALGLREDGSPRYRLVLARKPSTNPVEQAFLDAQRATLEPAKSCTRMSRRKAAARHAGQPRAKTCFFGSLLHYPLMSRPVVLSTWAGISPSCRSPVVSVPDGSNIKMAPPGDDGLCSTPLGTTKMSPGAQLDGAFPAAGFAQRDVELAVDHQEELIGVVVDVPDVLTRGVRDFDVIIITRPIMRGL